MDETPPPAEDVPDFADDEPQSWLDRLPRIPWLSDAETLSKREAKAARDTMIAAILKYGELADEAIPLLSRTHKPCVIWSDLDDKEAAALADWLLAGAQRFAPVAAVVRGAVATYSWFEVGAITVPRFFATFRYYLENGFLLSFKLGITRRAS